LNIGEFEEALRLVRANLARNQGSWECCSGTNVAEPDDTDL